jgi:Lon protease-like protein
VVLFPGTTLPLHVFEPRYRKMVADALASDRTIGMVLLRPGWEADYEGRPPVFAVGCAGRMTRVEALPDGRYDLALQATTRFRIVEEHGGEPYRLATVEEVPEDAGDPAALADARRAVLAAIGRAADGPTRLVVADLPDGVFVNGLCQALALDPVERQSLLECETIAARARRLAEVIEFRTLEDAHRRRIGDGGGKPPRLH